jgi:OOP family OmpA-OmpF porin
MKLNHTKFAISFATLKPYLLMLLFVLCILNVAIVRADDNARGWYIGAGIGKTTSNLDNRNIVEEIVTDQFTVNSIDSDRNDTGYKLFAGYQFNSHVSLEGGYFDLGKTDFTALVTPTGSLYGRSEFRGINLDLIGSVPFTEKLSGFGLVGVTYAERKDKFTPSEAIFVSEPNRDDKNFNPKIGLGLQYAFTPSWVARLEVERYRLNDAIDDKGCMNLVTLGLVYKFGRKTEARNRY